MALIRELKQDDIPKVSNLYNKVFGEGNICGSTEQNKFFDSVFLRNPWVNPKTPSLVYEEEGNIAGFLGIIPRNFTLNGQKIRTALVGNFMVDAQVRSPLAGMQLLKRCFAGPQDLTYVDTANENCKVVWEAVGGGIGKLYCLGWSRILEPGQYLVSLLNGRVPSCFVSMAKPLGSLGDFLVRRFKRGGYPLKKSSLGIKENIEVETILENLPLFLSDYSLQPTYDKVSLQWLLDQAEKKVGQGTLQKIGFYDRNEKLVGWCLYYVKVGGPAKVLKLVAKRSAIKDILDGLFYHAWQKGAVSISGRLEPRFLTEFSNHRCSFSHFSGWMCVNSSDQQVLTAVHSGNAFLSRLDGGGWMTIPWKGVNNGK